MQQSNIRRFLRISELYLRITEQRRSAANIEEIAPLIFSDIHISNKEMAIETHARHVETAAVV